MEAMEALRSTNQGMRWSEIDTNRTNSSAGKVGNPGGGQNVTQTQPGQGLAALLVMIAVLCFILAYCCWGAPCCRAFCRRRCFCCHSGGQDIEASPSEVGLSVDQGMGATPTIILLPYGRMLVVDGTVFAQLQADNSGLDLIELGENVVRAQQRAGGLRSTLTLNSLGESNPSILELDSETTSKDGFLSPLTGMPPPTYNEIFGSSYIEDLPPTYDEILMPDLETRDEDVCHEYTTEDEIRAEEYRLGEIRESRV